ncbi:hypothetical protein [Pseudoalteromonas luteoviolacea]|uniref:Right handed beta helix domain-containing protein n=1 Tax=Pseudoalteromonas luteoviolacea S4060-1 TaxID=1365257 RepID=A0A161YQL6_9GAMM|nr:hypothetical protein [Pseudoalteromonas luteoviolacea]KZN64425.1 hypothetical protein N478_22275 [Pseudoalteromonas luteoviolacea S4060-1]
MNSIRLAPLGVVATCLCSTVSVAHEATKIADDQHTSHWPQKQITKEIRCTDNPQALRNALNKTYNSQSVRFVISGECRGPIKIQRSGIEIVNDSGLSGSLRVRARDKGVGSAILIESSSVKLDNFNIDVPNDVVAVEAKANATLTLNHITTNAKAAEQTPFYQFVVKDNSTAYLSELSSNTVGIYNSSYANFIEDCDQIKVDVYDTSAGYSKSENHFRSVQVAGNGYFLADDESHINLLMVWSKGAAEINNESSVDELQMGGQSLFAAYKNSTISGPYSLWGNVVFELEHSKAYNWKALSKPNSIIAGHNATVNGVFYPDWQWTGQDSK